jgi:serine/threonine-protein kinase
MIGEVIHEQYRVLELIGEGGMGEVYKAVDLELGREVALKFLKAEFGDDHILVQRFRDELRVLATFNHPNITTLYTTFTWQSRPVMVMELVEGETLEKMVRRRGPIPAQIAVPLITQALAGVGQAHHKQIIHRDLKPANLMLNRDGVVKVMDFGIAKMQNAPGLTRSNTALGTCLYMAPEQIRGNVDARSDIYAMGVTLYELLAGTPPFTGDSEYDIQSAHIQQIPQPPTVFYPHIPTQVVQAVLRALAKDPNSRFQSAEEFANALGDGKPQTVSEPAILLSLPVPAPLAEITSLPKTAPPPRSNAESGPKKPSRSRSLGATLAVAVLLVLLVGGYGAHVFLNHSSSSSTTAGKDSAGGSSSASTTAMNVDIGNRQQEFIAPSPKIEKSIPDPGNLENTGKPIGMAPTPPSSGAKTQTPAYSTTSQHDGLAGRWTGTYESCEDNSRTPATLNLVQPSPGMVTGTIQIKVPSRLSEVCSLNGVFLGRKNSLSFSVSSCKGGAIPYYLQAPHRNLLQLSGGELSGEIEPQNPCMTAIFRRNNPGAAE